MNRTIASLVLALFLFPSLAMGDSVKYGDLVERDGLYYKKFTDVPFTGNVTGKKQGSFRNGKKEGPWVSYHENGQFGGKGTFKDGKEDGSWVYYHENGKVSMKLTYVEGKLDGPFVSYYENGRLQEQGTLKDGKREGPYVNYWENGKLVVKGTYKNDVKISD